MDWGSKTIADWRAAAPKWGAYTRHAFVEKLGDGTLPKASFLHYLVQDYVFLIHFSRAWALGVVKAETHHEMSVCAAIVNALAHDEMQLHVGICAREGISEDQLFNAVEADANLAYTRYVLDAGLSGDFLDLMAALAPCVFGYAEIGTRLAAEAAPDTPYREWIETYAGEDYQGHCRNVGAMIDEAVAHRLGNDPQSLPRWQALNKRFAMATRLEVDFWQMGLEGRWEPSGPAA
ncbi:thiaminase II [Rhodobacteraceae bacterium NNCM2]|nr:thiaminase II [Coraliihabitans acroporae]